MSQIHKIYLDHQKALKRLLWRFYKRAEDVDDAAQEAFLRAYAAEEHTKIKAPKKFLFQVARNYALNDIAKKENAMTDSITDFDGSSVLEDKSRASIEGQIDSRRKLALLAEAVKQLPPQCQRVFVMRKIEGLRVKDIAEQLGVAVGTVDKHLATGLARCSEYLSAHGYDDEGSGMNPIREGERRSGQVIRPALGKDHD